MARWATGILVTVLLVTTAGIAIGSPAAVGGPTGPAATEQSAPQFDRSASAATADLPTVETPPYDTLAQDFDRATNEFVVYANGSARWTTRFFRPLNESTRPDFEAYAEEFNTAELEVYRSFRTQANNLAALGTDITGREMNATGFSRRAYVDEDAFAIGSRGVVEMSYLWTSMGRVDGDTVEVGDVFGGGFSLGPRFELVVRPGPGLAFASAVPEPDSMADPDSLRESRSITWEGARDFTDQRPLIELAPPASLTTVPTTTAEPSTVETTGPGVGPTTDAATATTAATTAPADASGGGGSDLTMFVVGVIVLLLGLGTAAVWRATTGTDDAAGPSAAAETEAASSSGGTRQPSPTTESTDAGASETVPEEELLSDADRVKQLLETNDGRMRQSEIVEETGWSKSKVSMLLSDMEDEDEISKLRVGRENLISLPGNEPDAAGSPFDEEE